MGMGIEENELVVAKIIASDSKEVRPLAIRVKGFEVRGLTEGETQVALERLKERGVIKNYEHCWGFFSKGKGKKIWEFNLSGDAPQFNEEANDDVNKRTEQEVYAIEFNATSLKKFIESKKHGVSAPKLFEKRGENFIFQNEPLHFVDKTSIHYRLFSILYGDDGDGRRLPYETINKKLVGLGEEKIEDNTKMIRRIKNAVNLGLYERVNERLREYVKIVPRFGVEFINPFR